MMRQTQAVVLVVAGVCGMVAGVLVERGLLSRRQQAAPPPVRVESSRLPVEPAKDAGDTAVAALNQEKAQLQAEIDALWRQLREAKDQLLRALLKEALAEMAKPTHRDNARVVWLSDVDRIRAREGQFSAGIQAMVEMLVDFARLGDTGVDILFEILDDPEVSEEEKDAASMTLLFMPDTKVLNGLLRNELTEYESGDFGDQLTCVERQVAKLTRAEVLPYAAEVRQLAESQPEHDLSEEVLALLAEMEL